MKLILILLAAVVLGMIAACFIINPKVKEEQTSGPTVTKVPATTGSPSPTVTSAIPPPQKPFPSPTPEPDLASTLKHIPTEPVILRQANASVVEIASRVNFVTSLDSDSDGRIIYTEFQTGRLNILDPIGDGTFKERYLTTVPLPDKDTLGQNQGLWHALLDPSEQYLYVYAIDQTAPPVSKVVRMPYRDGIVVGDTEVFLSGISGEVDHYGGAMAFGPKGNLYLTTGDIWGLPGEKPKVGGAILRVGPNGQIPSDNPTATSYIYAHGFRNPYGMDFDTVTWELYVADSGPACCGSLRRVVAGKYHGWPDYGLLPDDIIKAKQDTNVVAPLFDTGPENPTPTQLISYRGDRYGEQFNGNLFFGTFGKGDVRRVKLSDDGLMSIPFEDQQHQIALSFERARAIIGLTATPDGHIYYATLRRIFRIESFGITSDG